MADLTSLPGRLDITVWHGRTETILLNWPDGALDGRGPWTATVTADDHDPIILPVTVDGDVMTITVPQGATTDLLHVIAQLVLDDDGRPVIAGTWRTSDNPGPSVTEATVTIEDQEVTVTTVPLPQPPQPPPTNELDVAEAIDSDITGLSTGGGLQLIAVPGLVVTVPDLARPVWIMAQAVLDFDTAPASLACAIAEPGSSNLGQQIAFAGGVVNVSTDLVSQMAWARLPPSSPGDWQMFVWASVAGDIDIRVASVSPARIAVLAV